MRPVIIACLLAVAGCASLPVSRVAADQIIYSEQADFGIEIVSEGLENPWSLAFLPDGRMLVTERPGRLRIIDLSGQLSPPLSGLPPIATGGQGGLLDVVLDPDFLENSQIYVSYSAKEGGSYSTHVAKAVLTDFELTGVETIFKAGVDASGGRHFGSRLVFDNEGMLLITHGDRGMRQLAQNRQSRAGSVLRIATDGSIPRSNPFAGQTVTDPAIFTLGHRNPQGMAMHPRTGKIWLHEHGPKGGDEVNILQPGANYGWPVVSYGAEYATGQPVSTKTSLPGLADPIHIWVPSIAPSGMAFYTAGLFPQWQGDLFVGALAGQSLVRLELDGERVVGEEQLIYNELGRIRDVRQGPDGALYLLIDDAEAMLVRLVPAA